MCTTATSPLRSACASEGSEEYQSREQSNMFRRLLVCVVFSVVIQSARSFIASTHFPQRVRSVIHRTSRRAFVDRGSTLQMGASKRLRKSEKDARRLEKEAMSADLQIKTDKLAEDLVEQCSMPERDLECINGIIQHVKAVSTPLKPARSQYLNHDWRLVFATDNDAISAVGTGLHTLPLTRMQELFVSFRGGTMMSVETLEVLRVLGLESCASQELLLYTGRGCHMEPFRGRCLGTSGPFPNVRNKLSGDRSTTGPQSVRLRYTSMIDGNGRKTGSEYTGAPDRLVDIDIVHVGEDAMVVLTPPSPKQPKGGQLVFVRERDMQAALEELRVNG